MLHSNVTTVNGVGDNLSFPIAIDENGEERCLDDFGELFGPLDVELIAEKLKDPSTAAEIAKRLDEDRAEGEWENE